MDYEHEKFLAAEAAENQPQTTTTDTMPTDTDTTTTQSKVHPPTAPITLISTLAEKFAAAHAALAERVSEAHELMEMVRKQHLKPITKAVEKAQEARANLVAMIESMPHLFVKPRTLVIHGIRCGFKKGQDKLVVTSVADTVQMIRTHLPDLAAALIRQPAPELSKAALGTLPDAQLAQLGITTVAGKDETVAVSTLTNVDRLVAALLADPTETPEG